MKKKIYIFITLILCYSLIKPTNAFALSSAVYLGDEVLDNTNTTNTEGTAIYDYEENTLTLNNYNGQQIQYNEIDELTIILEGTNTITSDFMYEGIYSTAALNITGAGSLLIKNSSIGIYIEEGDLLIESNVTIENIVEFGIKLYGGNASINGPLVMDSDKTIMEEELGYYMGYTAMQVRYNIDINNDITIKNANNGLIVNGMIMYNDGDTTIEAETTGIQSAKRFLMIGGKLDIILTEGENSWMPKYGLTATGNFEMTYGALHILVPDGSVAIIVNDEDGITPNLIIDSDLEIIPNTNEVMDVELVEGTQSKTIASSTDSIANEVTIKEKKIYTYEITKGLKQQFTEKKIKDYKLTIDGDYNLFSELIIANLDLIKDTDYIVTEGSTIITFTNSGIEKLNTLNNGEYNVVAKYTNNKEVQAKLIININNPKTIDNINLYIIIGLSSLLGLISIAFYLKKINK